MSFTTSFWAGWVRLYPPDLDVTQEQRHAETFVVQALARYDDLGKQRQPPRRWQWCRHGGAYRSVIEGRR